MIDSVGDHSPNCYYSSRKVRLKCRVERLRQWQVVSMLVIFCTIVISSVSCDAEIRNNRPPRFLIDNQHSEIVLRLKEGPETPVGN